MVVIVAENPIILEARSEPICREGCFACREPLVGEFNERADPAF